MNQSLARDAVSARFMAQAWEALVHEPRTVSGAKRRTLVRGQEFLPLHGVARRILVLPSEDESGIKDFVS